MEFLGDAVLGLVTAEILFNNYEITTSHLLKQYRSKLVQNTSLHCFADSKGMCSLVIPISRTEKQCADFLEALIGSFYLHLRTKECSHPTEIIELWLNNELQYEQHLENMLQNPDIRDVCESQDMFKN